MARAHHAHAKLMREVQIRDELRLTSEERWIFEP
jgi:hypothetical protein